MQEETQTITVPGRALGELAQVIQAEQPKEIPLGVFKGFCTTWDEVLRSEAPEYVRELTPHTD
jgi:hypothetical protein